MEGRPLRAPLHQLFAGVRTVLTRRISVPLRAGGHDALAARRRALHSRLAGRKLVDVNRMDGVTLVP